RRAGSNATVPAESLYAIAQALGERGWSVEVEGRPLFFDGVDAMSVRSGIDWFDLEAHFDFEGGRAELPAILQALKERTSLVRLANGGFGVLPQDWLGRWGALLSSGKESEGKLRFTRGRAFLLDALLAAREDVGVDEGFARLRDSLRSAHAPRAE